MQSPPLLAPRRSHTPSAWFPLAMYRLDIFCLIPFCICLAREVKLPTIDLPGQGKIVGVEVSQWRVQKIIAYYGIPYAQPPVGNLRFAPPVTDPLPEVANNTGYLPACPQTDENYKDSDKPFLQLISDLKFGNFSEDCLYLNIFVPSDNVGPQPGLATIIWFHPGSFVIGTPTIWNPHTLVYRQRVIVVTVAYRLNVFGFFTTMDGEAPGNYGLLDQQAAMQWVKANIALFGGDANNICLMGYGAGATSVGLHMVNGISRGLFNKAIAMSGDFLSPTLIKRPEEDKEFIDSLAKKFGCDRLPTSRLISCLRHLDADLLLQQTSRVDWRPLLDTDLSNSTFAFIPELPITVFERDDQYKIPFFTGYTHMEQVLEVDSIKNISSVSNEQLKKILIKLIEDEIPRTNDTESSCVFNPEHITDSVMFFYGPTRPLTEVEQFRQIVSDFLTEKDFGSITYQQALLMSKDKPTYVYRFDMKPISRSVVSQIPDWVTVPHLFDLLYVWGVPYWEKASYDWDIRDKRISDTIMALWTSFAKYSNPTEKIIYPIKWEPFTKDNPGILIIDSTFNMSNSETLNYKAFEFWSQYYPKVKEIASRCCDISGTGSRITLYSYWTISFVWILLTHFCLPI